jgi:hypothetical protein
MLMKTKIVIGWVRLSCSLYLKDNLGINYQKNSINQDYCIILSIRGIIYGL